MIIEERDHTGHPFFHCVNHTHASLINAQECELWSTDPEAWAKEMALKGFTVTRVDGNPAGILFAALA